MYCTKDEREFVMYMMNKCTNGMILNSPKRGNTILVNKGRK